MLLLLPSRARAVISFGQVFRALLRQEIAFFDVQTTGAAFLKTFHLLSFQFCTLVGEALVSRLTNDTGTLQNAASSLQRGKSQNHGVLAGA